MDNQKGNLKNITGVGEKTLQSLSKLGISNLQDLLFHLPTKYQDKARLHLISQLKAGQIVLIEGRVIRSTQLNAKKKMYLYEVADASGAISVCFFHLLPFQKQNLIKDAQVRLFGEVRLGYKGAGFQMVQPEVYFAKGEIFPELTHFLTPIYPLTEGLNQHKMRKLIEHALQWMQTEFFLELIPPEYFSGLSCLPSIKEALLFVHRPSAETNIERLIARQTPAHLRMVVEELIANRLNLLFLKKQITALNTAVMVSPGEITKRFINQLPFSLTKAQLEAIEAIQKDLVKTHPMLRLIQGDVGCGKTVIAAIAMSQILDNGYQSALLVPTELLAQQHCRVLSGWFKPLGVSICLLTSGMTPFEKAQQLQKIESGEIPIIIGTHALLQTSVQFKNLGLVVVDEQHRFGVHQRSLLFSKGKRHSFSPHQLVLTATPIPRTLFMSFFADLDCSVIDELPPGRVPIVTSVMPNTKRQALLLRIKEACKKKQQVYWVCPRVEVSELISCDAATNRFNLLQKALPGVPIGLLHGRMSKHEKEKVMMDFHSGTSQILVATTVIEVGVDVPNATIMIIENSEKLGLAQLHQLRGRVGRGASQSYCILLYEAPLSAFALARLKAMRETSDGFEIAQYDLELRGPGEILGTDQSGMLSFKVADLNRDSHLLPSVHKMTERLFKEEKQVLENIRSRWIDGEQSWIGS